MVVGCALKLIKESAIPVEIEAATSAILFSPHDTS